LFRASLNKLDVTSTKSLSRQSKPSVFLLSISTP